MREVVVFIQVSLDGYFVDRNGDMSWAKGGNDAEFNSFAFSRKRISAVWGAAAGNGKSNVPFGSRLLWWLNRSSF